LESCGQGGGVETFSDAITSAGDMAASLAFAAVVVERGKPSKSRHFFTRKGSEFGHADEEGDCGALANARHADQEKQDGEEAFEFDGAALFETRGVRSNTTPTRAP
jgi:hypothetical protein